VETDDKASTLRSTNTLFGKRCQYLSLPTCPHIHHTIFRKLLHNAKLEMILLHDAGYSYGR